MIEKHGLRILLVLYSLTASLALLSVSYAGSHEKSDEKEVVARVGAYEITVKDLTERAEKLPSGLKVTYETEVGKENLLREMVRIEVFSREAQSIGLHKDEDFQDRIEEITKALLAREYTKKILARVKVSDEDAENFYREHLDEFKEPERIKAPSVFIRIPVDASQDVVKEKEAEAREILERLKKREDFSKLSKEFPEASCKKCKGEPGYFARGALVPEIEEDVFGLKIGEISPILKVKDGFIIFKLEDRIPERGFSFEEVREQIMEQLRNEKQRNEFEDTEKKLFSKYNVVFKNKKGKKNPTQKHENRIGIRGKISNIFPADAQARKRGIGTLLIEGSKEGRTEIDKASVKVKGITRIFKKHGKELQFATFEDLMIGQWVEVRFTGPVLQSYPVQAAAEEIVIIQPLSKH